MYTSTMISTLYLVAGAFMTGVTASAHTRLVCCEKINNRWTYNAELTKDVCSNDYSNEAQFRNSFCTGTNDNKLAGTDFFNSCKNVAAAGYTNAAGKVITISDGNLVGSGDSLGC